MPGLDRIELVDLAGFGGLTTGAGAGSVREAPSPSMASIYASSDPSSDTSSSSPIAQSAADIFAFIFSSASLLSFALRCASIAVEADLARRKADDEGCSRT